MTAKTKTLIEIAMVSATAVILGLLKLWEMPQGGAITLESVPILVFSIVRGWKVGIIAGALTGILQLIFGGYVVHPVQLLLDYPVAFGLLGIAGLVRKPIWLGITLGCAARFLAHFVSGVVFFASYAPKGVSVYWYSFVYNISYMGPVTIISIIVAYLLVPKLKNILG